MQHSTKRMDSFLLNTILLIRIVLSTAKLLDAARSKFAQLLGIYAIVIQHLTAGLLH